MILGPEQAGGGPNRRGTGKFLMMKLAGGLEVWASYPPIAIDISISITTSNYFLEYCLIYILFIA